MSNKYPHLNNAPIVEALIDIKYKLSDNFDLNLFKKFAEKKQSIFKTSKLIRELEAEIIRGEEINKLSHKDELVGYRLISNDGKKILGLQKKNFTFSILKPYTNWKDLVNQAKEYWTKINKIIEAEHIHRVAVRYINNLNIKPPINEFSDYLTSPPTIHPNLPQAVSSFLTRIVLPNPEKKITAIITQSLTSGDYSKSVPIILDIDVFQINNKGYNELEIWQTLEIIRDYKNDIFFNSITKRQLEVYK